MLISSLTTIIFLFLGLLNPVEGNQVDALAGFFVFGFTSAFIFVPLKRIQFLAICLPLSWIIFSNFKEFNLIVVYGSLIGVFSGLLLCKLKKIERFAIWILIVSFLFSSWIISADLRRFLVSDVAYNNDPGVLLKTYTLMGEGIDYYDAFRTAQLGRFSQPIVPGDIWGWRLPTLFLIWKLVPGTSGLSIYFLSLILSSIIIYIAFRIGRRYLGYPLGLLSSYLISPYFHFAARDQMFLETEWWSVIFFILGVYFLVCRSRFWATIFMSATLLIREVYILPIGLMLIYALIKKRDIIIIFLIPLLAFLVLFTYHITRVNDYIDVWRTLFSPRVVPNGSFFVQQTLAFASWEYMLAPLRPLTLMVGAAIFGCLSFLKTKYRDEIIFWVLGFLPFPIAFLRFGTLPYNDYWGIIYVPLAIVLAPLVLYIVKKDDRLDS